MNDLTLTKAKLSTNDSKKQSFESLTDNLAFTKNVVIFFNSSKVSTIKSTSIHFGITEEKVINILTKEMPNELSNWILRMNEPELFKSLSKDDLKITALPTNGNIESA